MTTSISALAIHASTILLYLRISSSRNGRKREENSFHVVVRLKKLSSNKRENASKTEKVKSLSNIKIFSKGPNLKNDTENEVSQCLKVL